MYLVGASANESEECQGKQHQPNCSREYTATPKRIYLARRLMRASRTLNRSVHRLTHIGCTLAFASAITPPVVLEAILEAIPGGILERQPQELGRGGA